MELLNFEDVSGVFSIMISGVALSYIFAGWIFLWNIRNIAIKHDVIIYLMIISIFVLRSYFTSYKNYVLQVSFTEELIEELKFLIKCSNKTTVRRKKSVGSKSDTNKKTARRKKSIGSKNDSTGSL